MFPSQTMIDPSVFSWYPSYIKAPENNKPSIMLCLISILSHITLTVHGSLTLAHSQNSQMSFMYGFFFVKFLFFTVVCVVIVV